MSTKIANSLQDIVDRINAVLGEGKAHIRDDKPRVSSFIDVGFYGALESSRLVSPATRERTKVLLSLRTSEIKTSGRSLKAVLIKHEAALTALVGYVPLQAQNLHIGLTRQAEIELGRSEVTSVETELEVTIQLQGVER